MVFHPTAAVTVDASRKFFMGETLVLETDDQFEQLPVL